MNQNLQNAGWPTYTNQLPDVSVTPEFSLGRIISEHKERYEVLTESGEFPAEITGNLRFTATGREDFPAVGDWVELKIYGSDMAIIHRVLPRYSILQRQAVASSGDIQLIATNIDYAFLVQAAGRDFNVNRMERYLTVCYSGKVNPIILISKSDLASPEMMNEITTQIQNRLPGIPIVPISSLSDNGLKSLTEQMIPGKTYCMMGSSGVGKSTLLNALTGRQLMETGQISESTGKGRHVTSHRELVILENGSILIDTPGMRELGIADDGSGLETTFDAILELADSCRFTDCTHTSETGCAVLEAVQSGELHEKSYQNYLKLLKERQFFETSQAKRKQKEKMFGRIVKEYKRKNPKGR